MKQKCDKCDKPAVVHTTDIIGGQKIEKHLCEDCASGEGITIKAGAEITQLLEDFVLQTSRGQESADLKCGVCGMTWADFGQHGLLGCPNDYDRFERPLRPLLARAHEGATQHIGKTPCRAGADQKVQTAILRLRAELNAAIAAEDYEKAARLRDRIKNLEHP
ncbi:MAG: UvrB/UvrC motif-containing protein [Phycisphaerae bacterium]